MAKLFTYIDWTLRIIVAVILGQTLFFKFSGAPESVEIFTKLGIEPYGRIGIGIAELIAVILILTPRTVTLGALLSGGLMAGALMSHITKLGFAGEMASLATLATLATLAVVAGLASAGALWIHRRKIPVIGKKFT